MWLYLEIFYAFKLPIFNKYIIMYVEIMYKGLFSLACLPLYYKLLYIPDISDIALYISPLYKYLFSQLAFHIKLINSH